MSKIKDIITPEQEQALRKEIQNESSKVGEPNNRFRSARTRSYVKVADTNFVDRAIEKFGKEAVELALLVKNNAEIRRFTSKNIIAQLIEDKVVNAEDKVHVEFLWNKFKVTRNVNGNNLSTEYLYTELAFIQSLVKSFEQFSESATQTIGAFVNAYNVDVCEK